MRTTRDVVLVSTPSKYNNQIEIAGGKVLWLDTSYQPLHHVSISGKVEAVPGLLSPRHYGHGKSTMDLEVGDKVYFNYLTIDPENLMPYRETASLSCLRHIATKLTIRWVSCVI
mgnify:CR=1 FL=1